MKDRIKQVIEVSGLYVKEFGSLAGVTRAAVHGWMNGANINPLRINRMYKILAAVESAIAAGDLPMSRSGMKGFGADELSTIKGIVVRHLKLLSKVP